MALHSSWCPTGDQAWAMIDDLNAGEAEMWKYVDDTTISEVIAKGQESCIQQMVDDRAIRVRDEGFQLKERKCKELRISFAKNKPKFDPIWVHHQTLETEKYKTIRTQYK